MISLITSSTTDPWNLKENTYCHEENNTFETKLTG
jgi:hypothetical protein